MEDRFRYSLNYYVTFGFNWADGVHSAESIFQIQM